MTCAHCARKDKHIAELEKTIEFMQSSLRGAIPHLQQALSRTLAVEDSRTDLISTAFDLTKQQAYVVEILFDAGETFVRSKQIDEALPMEALGNSRRTNSLHRTAHYSKVVIGKIRTKCGRSSILTFAGHGYKLSPDFRLEVSLTLKEKA